jgi:hypothetical protein
VWNIKLHMPTGTDTDAWTANPDDTDDTDAWTANPDDTDAWTVAVATKAFPAGTGASWHALQRHVP